MLAADKTITGVRDPAARIVETQLTNDGVDF
jgi:hypothetical protein